MRCIYSFIYLFFFCLLLLLLYFSLVSLLIFHFSGTKIGGEYVREMGDHKISYLSIILACSHLILVLVACCSPSMQYSLIIDFWHIHPNKRDRFGSVRFVSCSFFLVCNEHIWHFAFSLMRRIGFLFHFFSVSSEMRVCLCACACVIRLISFGFIHEL